MSDIADDAQDQIDAALAAQIALARTSGARLTPVGECHYCGDLVSDHQLFCGKHCAERHDKELRLRGRTGR